MSTPAATPDNEQAKWTEEWDAKLKSLFDSGELNIDTLTKQHLDPIRKAHFPGYKYKNFSALVRRKVNIYRVGKEQTGHRKRQAEGTY
jgi:hypothetical protein